jgi:hypothetical protein
MYFPAFCESPQQPTKLRCRLHSAYRLIRSTLVALGLTLTLTSPLRASEFIDYCRGKLARAEPLFAECKRNAQPLVREFLPGGRGPAVQEEHRVWLAPTEAQGRFGLGCVLDGQGKARFFGIYFALDPRNHHLIGDANLTFADFSGNVGFRAKDGKLFVLLAMHGFTVPGEQRVLTTSKDCVAPPFDPMTDATLLDDGKTLVSLRASTKGIIDVRTCWNVQNGIDEKKCVIRPYYSFMNERSDGILYITPLGDTIITRTNRILMRKNNFDTVCNDEYRARLNYSGFMKEACALQTEIR